MYPQKNKCERKPPPHGCGSDLIRDKSVASHWTVEKFTRLPGVESPDMPLIQVTEADRQSHRATQSTTLGMKTGVHGVCVGRPVERCLLTLCQSCMVTKELCIVGMAGQDFTGYPHPPASLTDHAARRRKSTIQDTRNKDNTPSS